MIKKVFETDPESLHLQQKLHLLDRALAYSSCGITIADARLPDRPLIYVNPAFERLTGYTEEDVLGKNCRFLQGEEKNQSSLQDLKQALKIGSDCTVVLRNFRKDGQPFWNELIISPVFSPDRTLTHFIGVQTDITRRKEAEDALIQAKEELEQRVLERTAALHQAYESTLEGWIKALDIRDHETEGHTQRVTEMTVLLAQEFGFTEAELTNVRRGALLHDIGKIGIPDHVLLKPGPLTAEEQGLMQQHPVYAYQWLFPISYLRPSLDIPYCHHERWDGTGYPCGLKGEEIPLAARLFAVVDVWDALRSDRPYRKGWPEAKTRAHIQSLAGTHFDPEVVEVFLNLLSRKAESLLHLKQAA